MKKLFFIISFIVLLLPAYAQESTDTLNSKPILLGQWQTPQVNISGKLKMQGRPLSPSLKIFMLKDSLIDISVRAPFVGEAGRLVLTPDSVTLVNKMNKIYTKEGISDFLKYYPGGISDVQDLLLAHFFLPGFNLGDSNLEDLVDIYYVNDQYNVIPKGEAEIPGIVYGFIVDEYFNPLTLVVLPESNPDIEIDAFYNFSVPPISNELEGDYSIQLIYQEDNKALKIDLDLKKPQWGGESPKPLEVSKKFRQVSLSDFLHNF